MADSTQKRYFDYDGALYLVGQMKNRFVAKETGKGLSVNDYTTDEKNKLAGIEANAEVNQNAFTNITAGATKIEADSKTDTLIVVGGTGITVTGDADNDSITIANDGVLNVATGSADGTISVDGTDVNVKGLASAAYLNKETTLSATADDKIPTSKAVATYVNSLGFKTTDHITTAEDSGTGNGVASVTADSEGKLTVTKATFLVAADIANKANSATTLAGYGITDAYTKEEVNGVTGGLQDAIDAVEADIETLKGTGTGSIANTVATAIAEIVNDNNNGSIDTLNEIASWIVNDTTGAAKMQADITSLQNDKQATISDLEAIRSNASTGAGLKTKVDGIAEGAQVNVIEEVKVNGTALTITGKSVDVTVPTVTDTYSATSGNAMSGKAVASAISGLAKESDFIAITNDEIDTIFAEVFED